ncbi:MAG: acyltransferase family protein [Clostridiales bacterium]
MMENNISSVSAGKGERLTYLDMMRIFATFTVIVLHASAEHWLEVPVSSYQWQVFNIYNSFVRFNVQLFVLISGALFLDKAVSIKKLYTKNILRLLTAYIVWSSIYALVYAYFGGSLPGNSLRAIVVHLVKALINSHYHLWFVPMIIGVYMMVPILKPITGHKDCKNICRYFLILFLLFGILKPSVFAFQFPYKETLSNLANVINVGAAAGWLGYLVLGYYLKQYDMSRSHRNLLYLSAAAGYIFTAAASSYLSLQTGNATSFFTFSFSLSSFLSTAACFVFFKYEVAKIQLSDKLIAIIGRMSKNMFGLYLIHAMVLRVLLALGLSGLTFNAAISVPFVSLVTFIVSYVLVELIAKIPLLNKYII